MWFEAGKDPMVRCRAEHVLVTGRRKSAVIFSVYAVEQIRCVNKREDSASINGGIMIISLLDNTLYF